MPRFRTKRTVKPAPNQVAPETASQDARNTKEQPVFLPQTTDRWIIRTFFANLILALCAIASILIVWIQSSEQNSVSRKSIALAESSYVLTRRSIELAERSFEIENRPYVSTATFSIDTFTVGKRLSGRIFIRNYGKTPALRLSLQIEVAGYTTSTISSFPYHRSQERGSVSVLPPTEVNVIPFATNGIMTNDNVRQALSKQVYWFIYGKLTYNDVFSRLHTTTFCVSYDFRDQVFLSNPSYNEDL